MTPEPPLVRCENVGRTFGAGDRAVVAVHDVTCAVASGARIALTGASGSGKTTLAHLLAGLDEPTRGRIEWPGLADTRRQNPHLIGMVFQEASLVPALTARENVALPLVLRGIDHEQAQVSALDAMTRLGVAGFADQVPDELSGGQGQRVAVARVLAMQPRFIVADEPTGRLDQSSAQHVIDVLLDVAVELGAALLVSTHDPHVAARMDDAWLIRDGALQVPADAIEGAL